VISFGKIKILHPKKHQITYVCDSCSVLRREPNLLQKQTCNMRLPLNRLYVIDRWTIKSRKRASIRSRRHVPWLSLVRRHWCCNYTECL